MFDSDSSETDAIPPCSKNTNDTIMRLSIFIVKYESYFFLVVKPFLSALRLVPC